MIEKKIDESIENKIRVLIVNSEDESGEIETTLKLYRKGRVSFLVIPELGITKEASMEFSNTNNLLEIGNINIGRCYVYANEFNSILKKYNTLKKGLRPRNSSDLDDILFGGF